jgi:phosphoglycolate phosphatase
MPDPAQRVVPTVNNAAVEPRALPVDGVLFDLDGTLADTAPDLAAALNRVRSERGLEPLPLARLRPYASHGARGLLGAGMGILPDHQHYEGLRDAFLDQYAAALCVESALFAEVAALLDAIEARSLRWGIVTNKATRFTAPLLEALGLASRARAIVCGDTTPHAKPHPAPLLHAALQLGIAPARCVYVGDAERDVIAGVAAGMPTIVARYGYIEPQDAPEGWPASGSIDTPGGLLRWLPQHPGTSPGSLSDRQAPRADTPRR